jgi:hypothetical protein
MRRLAVAALCALVLAPAAFAAAPPSGPVYDGQGRLVQTPIAPPPPRPHLAAARVTELFFAYPKVRHWLERYPRKSRVWQTEFDAKARTWKV